MDTGAGVGLLDDSAALANVRADARKRSKTDDTQSAVVTDEDRRQVPADILRFPLAVPHHSPLSTCCRQVYTVCPSEMARECN